MIHIRIRKVGLLGHIRNVRFVIFVKVVIVVGVGVNGVIVGVAAHTPGAAWGLKHNLCARAVPVVIIVIRRDSTPIASITISRARAVDFLQIRAGNRVAITVILITITAEHANIRIHHGAVNLGEADRFGERRAVIAGFYFRQHKVVDTDTFFVSNVNRLDDLNKIIYQ